MDRNEKRISLPAIALAAVIGIAVTGGTASLFTLQAPAEPVIGSLVTAKTSTETLPMREIVPNRVDVIAVREPERVSVFQRVLHKVRG